MLPTEEVLSLTAEGCNINRAKEILAFEATTLAHGEEEAAKAFAAAGSKFGFADPENRIPTSSNITKVDTAAAVASAAADLPTYELAMPAEGIWIVQLLADAGLCKSNGEARRLIQAGGAYFNDERISDMNRTITAADFKDGVAMAKTGKKNVKRIVLK